MIGARWANAKVGNPAFAQDREEVTVTKASKILNVGERGIRHGKNILENGTPEEIDACDSGEAAVTHPETKAAGGSRIRKAPPERG